MDISLVWSWAELRTLDVDTQTHVILKVERREALNTSRQLSNRVCQQEIKDSTRRQDLPVFCCR